MKFPQYILINIAYFADGKATPAFQIGERLPDVGGKEVPAYATTNRVQNDPVGLKLALSRLQQLTNEVV